MTTLRAIFAGTVCVLLCAPASLAGHGKVGTWEVTTKMNGGSGMAGMPDMSKLPPSVQAQMKAHGVKMNAGGGTTTKYCMTAEQVAADKPPMSHRGACEPQNMKVKGNTFSADVVCKGEMNGKGHVEFTFDTPEHYVGHQSMTMTMEGRTMTHDMTMEGRWLSANCQVPPAKTVKPTP